MDLGSINPKLDDMIVLYLQAASDVVSQHASTRRLPGDIIGTYTSPAQQSPSLYLVGWRLGEPYPSKDPGVDPAASFIGRVNPYAFSQNKHKYAFAKWVEAFYEAEQIIIKPFDPSTQELLDVARIVGCPIVRPDVMCKNKTCRKMNSSDASVCWWCQVPNPC
jgi:hypothetical protein